MRERPWEIGLCGTFDVENYGDLLFPLIAERELADRLGAVRLHRFSYHSRTPPDWHYEVTSVADLPEIVSRLDGLLIGGGHLIRFDKEVAPGYAPPDAKIHHPSGYWLTPSLIAAAHDVPVIWNAPGLQSGDIPDWAKPLLETALNASRYIAVRDEGTRRALEPLTSQPISVVPDTAFGLPRLLNLDSTAPSDEFVRLSEACGLRSPYLVFQARLGQEGLIRFIRDHAARFRDFQILVLSMGPSLDEHSRLIETDLPNIIRLDEWPPLPLIAELIGRSQAVVGRSFHLMITALAYGVPVFTRQDLAIGKYQALQNFGTIYKLPSNEELDADWWLARVGKQQPSEEARTACERLVGHWDRIADELRAGPAPTDAAVNRLWQRVPALLEGAAGKTASIPTPPPVERDVLQDRCDAATRQLADARAELAARAATIDDLVGSIEAIRTSASWKMTAPARWAARLFSKPSK